MDLAFLNELQLPWYLLLAAFFACSALFWAIGEMVLDRQASPESRLQRFRDAKPGTNKELHLEGSKTGLSRLLEAASPALGETLKPKSEKEISNMKSKLNSAGFRQENAVALFSTLKVISALFGLFVGGGTALIVKGFDTWTLAYAVGTGMAFLLVPEMVLTFLAKRRKQQIFLGLPDALDLMVVSVEAGFGLDQAMRKVAEELSSTHAVIAYEFRICNQALQMGKPRAEVLHDLGERNGVEDLQTLASIMIQVDRFGTSIGQALRTQSDTMRVRRRQIAEEKAAKTAVKLIFPLVLFIFPGIFVVLVGPAAITMINELLPSLQK
ncbi:MAG TPA: type II secretion system F family protein [Pirellulaceae bacterium]|nr:type II secretion system F family protein [Pirellulaceae bacterium]